MKFIGLVGLFVLVAGVYGSFLSQVGVSKNPQYEWERKELEKARQMLFATIILALTGLGMITFAVLMA